MLGWRTPSLALSSGTQRSPTALLLCPRSALGRPMSTTTGKRRRSRTRATLFKLPSSTMICWTLSPISSRGASSQGWCWDSHCYSTHIQGITVCPHHDQESLLPSPCLSASSPLPFPLFCCVPLPPCEVFLWHIVFPSSLPIPTTPHHRLCKLSEDGPLTGFALLSPYKGILISPKNYFVSRTWLASQPVDGFRSARLI